MQVLSISCSRISLPVIIPPSLERFGRVALSQISAGEAQSCSMHRESRPQFVPVLLTERTVLKTCSSASVRNESNATLHSQRQSLLDCRFHTLWSEWYCAKSY